MAITVRIPQPLRSLTGDAPTVDGSGESLLACIDFLDGKYPGVRERVMDESGEIRRFVNVYINGDDVRFIQGLKSPLKDGDEVSIVPAVAGG
jgi:molybdopterin synthase sulfur carrier subunit